VFNSNSISFHAAMLTSNDHIVVYVGEQRFTGSIDNVREVREAVSNIGFGPPLLGKPDHEMGRWMAFSPNRSSALDESNVKNDGLIKFNDPSRFITEKPDQISASSLVDGSTKRLQMCVTPRGRWLTKSGNDKLRRAVHKLVLINRFNRSLPQTLSDDTKSERSANSGSTLRDWKQQILGGQKWYHISNGSKRVSKALETYVREQNNIYDYAIHRKDMGINDEDLPLGLFAPDSTWHVWWDFMVLAFVLYAAIMVPIQIGFDNFTSNDIESAETVMDCIFILDVVLNFFTTYSENGVLVKSRKKVAMHYLKTWFALDCISSFPINWFFNFSDASSSSNNASQVNKLLRMLRLFKLVRILRVFKLFPKLMSKLETSININPGVIRFLKSIFVLISVWHLIACAYWFVSLSVYNGIGACPQGTAFSGRACFVNQCLCTSSSPSDITFLNGTDATWYDANYPDLFVPVPQLAFAPFIQQYLSSVMFGVAATTSVGANIVPKFTSELVFAIITILFSLMIYSIVIGTASSALSSMNTAEASHKEVMDRILGFLRVNKVPAFFQKIVIEYYRHRWEFPSEFSSDVLEILPDSLRDKLKVVLNKDLIEKIPVLQTLQMNVYLSLVSKLTNQTFLPGEFITKQGEYGDSLYFLSSGRVDAVLPNGMTVFKTFQPGDFFGEHSMLTMAKRDTSFRAVDFVDLLVLSRPDFVELYITAPEFVREVQRVDLDRQKLRLSFELSVMKKTDPPVTAPQAFSNTGAWWKSIVIAPCVNTQRAKVQDVPQELCESEAQLPFSAAVKRTPAKRNGTKISFKGFPVDPQEQIPPLGESKSIPFFGSMKRQPPLIFTQQSTKTVPHPYVWEDAGSLDSQSLDKPPEKERSDDDLFLSIQGAKPTDAQVGIESVESLNRAESRCEDDFEVDDTHSVMEGDAHMRDNTPWQVHDWDQTQQFPPNPPPQGSDSEKTKLMTHKVEASNPPVKQATEKEKKGKEKNPRIFKF
jgi:Cyclic nucleotide-binding domain/Ion transport protein